MNETVALVPPFIVREDKRDETWFVQDTRTGKPATSHFLYQEVARRECYRKNRDFMIEANGVA